MQTTKQFRKRPVVIEAMRWDPSDLGNAGSVVGWLMAHGCDFHHPSGGGGSTTLAIKTLEGDMTAQPGDWIIRGVQGEFYPCKPHIFDATYESVDGDGGANRDTVTLSEVMAALAGIGVSGAAEEISEVRIEAGGPDRHAVARIRVMRKHKLDGSDHVDGGRLMMTRQDIRIVEKAEHCGRPHIAVPPRTDEPLINSLTAAERELLAKREGATAAELTGEPDPDWLAKRAAEAA